MSNDLYEEKLNWFKQNEKPEVVLLIADDTERIKIVVAWTNTATRRKKKLTRLRDDSDSEVWEWLWENVEYSPQELMLKSSARQYGFDSKLDSLIGNRVLYPDGTVNSFLQRYLRQRVLGFFDGKPKRAVKRRS